MGKAVFTGNQFLPAKKLALMQRDLYLPPNVLDFNFVKPAARLYHCGVELHEAGLKLLQCAADTSQASPSDVILPMDMLIGHHSSVCVSSD